MAKQAGSNGTLTGRGRWEAMENSMETQCPTKGPNFMWRACADILPTRDNLCRRRVDVDRNCEFCRQRPETGAHLLWECPFTRNAWSLSSGKVQKCRNDVWDFFPTIPSFGGEIDNEGTWNSGLLQRGQFGTQGTELTLKNFRHNLK